MEDGSTQQLSTLSTLLHGPQLNELRAELEFIAVHCEWLMKMFKSLEAREFKDTEIYNKMADLLSWMRNPGFPFATSCCEDAMMNAATKLSEYVEGVKQPALHLFRAIRIFDPRQLPMLSHGFSAYVDIIPSVDTAANGWQRYLDIAARELHGNGNNGNTTVIRGNTAVVGTN